MGGHVFGHSDPIALENIQPTLGRFVEEFTRVFPKAKKYLTNLTTLGSTGKKKESGDIDLALSGDAFKNIKDWGLSFKDFSQVFARVKSRARSASTKQLAKKATIQLIGQKLDAESSKIAVNTKGSGNGVLFCEFPQYGPNGELLGKNVQIDINVGDVDLLKFAYYSDSYPEGDKVKGLHRTQLIVSLFKNKGLTFSHNVGVKDKETGKVVANTPKKIIALLNDLYNFEITEEDMNNFYNFQEFLEKNLSKEDLDNVYGTYLRILDHTRCDIPKTLENTWLDRQEELGLTGKFLPTSSVLYPFRED